MEGFWQGYVFSYLGLVSGRLDSFGSFSDVMRPFRKFCPFSSPRYRTTVVLMVQEPIEVMRGTGKRQLRNA